MRELLVRAVGIERGGRHVFKTVSRTDNEVLLGVDQAHLGFRASVLVEVDRVVVSTLVELRNRRGRAYFAIVRRLHPMVVRACSPAPPEDGGVVMSGAAGGTCCALPPVVGQCVVLANHGFGRAAAHVRPAR